MTQPVSINLMDVQDDIQELILQTIRDRLYLDTKVSSSYQYGGGYAPYTAVRLMLRVEGGDDEMLSEIILDDD